ncbi:Txe/YoeB family addiction module toxin [uncultured Hymenobacter sp.]
MKGDLAGFWSRRINDEHRLIYKVTKETIIVIACRDHY